MKKNHHDLLPRRRQLCGLPAALLLGAAAPQPARAAEESVVVFAAASLTEVLRALARQGGFSGVRFSFAASSTLARQIEQGAPAQVFISADEAWMDLLQKAGHLVPDSRRGLAGNRLALIAPGRAGVAAMLAPPETAEVAAAAVRLRIDAALALRDARIATGDPAHVPVGRYARAALQSLDRWVAVAPRLARADNVRAALVLVERGEAPLGITYRTDALASPRVQIAALFPASSHPPIRYPAALLRGAGPGAQRFLDHLSGAPARPLWEAAGFMP